MSEASRRSAQKETSKEAPLSLQERDARLLLRLAYVAIAIGILLRVAAPFVMDMRQDGAAYVAMGHTIAEQGNLVLPYGEPVRTEAEPQPSHHYPPAYPFYLAMVFKVAGYGLVQAQVAAIVMSLAALGATWWATRDLYGDLPAALAAGIVALEPHLVWATGVGFSENMALLFFVLTMWAIVKSLKDERYILFAALFAGIAYLSRSSMGWFFLIAGAGGFLWRFYYQRWRVFTNPWYMGAIALFGAIVLAWAGRNVATFGWPNWQTSLYVDQVTGYAFDRPGMLFRALAQKAFLFLGYLAMYAAPFLGLALASWKRVREEETSALWLSVVLVWVLGWIMAAIFWVYEQTPMFWHDNHRYVVVGIVPLAWLLLRELKPDGTTLLRWGAVAAVLLTITSVVVLNPTKFPEARAAELVDPHLQPGDEIMVVGTVKKYSPYPYLSDPTSVMIYPLEGALGKDPDFIITGRALGRLANYTAIGTFYQERLTGETLAVQVLARDDLVAARGITPQAPVRS